MSASVSKLHTILYNTFGVRKRRYVFSTVLDLSASLQPRKRFWLSNLSVYLHGGDLHGFGSLCFGYRRAALRNDTMSFIHIWFCAFAIIGNACTTYKTSTVHDRLDALHIIANLRTVSTVCWRLIIFRQRCALDVVRSIRSS